MKNQKNRKAIDSTNAIYKAFLKLAKSKQEVSKENEAVAVYKAMQRLAK